MALSSPTPAGFGVATDWSQHSVVVLGAAASGLAIADVLHHLGASIAVLDDFTASPYWPPIVDGQVDTVREQWLSDDRFVAVELLIDADASLIIATRR